MTCTCLFATEVWFQCDDLNFMFAAFPEERVAAYSRLQHFEFSEGRLQEALEELRCSNANSFRHV